MGYVLSMRCGLGLFVVMIVNNLHFLRFLLDRAALQEINRKETIASAYRLFSSWLQAVIVHCSQLY